MVMKSQTTDEVFQEQCFLWERGASVVVDFDYSTLKTFYMYKNQSETLKDMKKNEKAH